MTMRYDCNELAYLMLFVDFVIVTTTTAVSDGLAEVLTPDRPLRQDGESQHSEHLHKMFHV